MDPIQTMVNGLPGNVARVVAEHVARDDRFALLPASLTGPEITDDACRIHQTTIELIRPDRRRAAVEQLRRDHGPFICVDYTHPSAVNGNAAFYCRHELPFVMGTTGGDREKLFQTVRDSATAAVIAPNMAKQIVGFQAMMEWAAANLPDLFKGYRLTIRESHQQGKADTSGTAKAMIACFNKLGAAFSADAIRMERDPQRQKTEWGIPEAHLAGHGWHTYTLRSPDDTVLFRFTHNVNGRDIYAAGTLDALMFLKRKIDQGAKGRVYSMIDVIK